MFASTLAAILTPIPGGAIVSVVVINCVLRLLKGNREHALAQSMRRPGGTVAWGAALLCSVALVVVAPVQILLACTALAGCCPGVNEFVWIPAITLQFAGGIVCTGMLVSLRKVDTRRYRLAVGLFGILTAAAATLELALSPPESSPTSWDKLESWVAGPKLLLAAGLALALGWGARQATKSLPLLGVDSLGHVIPPRMRDDATSHSEGDGQPRWSPKPASAARRSRNDVWEEWLTYSSGHTPASSARNTGCTESPPSAACFPVHRSCNAASVTLGSSGSITVPGTWRTGADLRAASSQPTAASTLTAATSISPALSASTWRSTTRGVDDLDSTRSAPNSPNSTPRYLLPCHAGSGDVDAYDPDRATAPAVLENGLQGSSGDLGRIMPKAVQVEVLGHVWVPDDAPGDLTSAWRKGGVHVEFLIRSSVHAGDDPPQPPRLIQRRFRDFDKLHEALARHAGIGLLGRWVDLDKQPLPPLPRAPGKNVSAAFATQRQRALQTWLEQVVKQPELWCADLLGFLGLGTPAVAAPTQSEAPSEEDLDELRATAMRMQLPSCGLSLEPGQSVKGAAIVRWLIGQALVGSKEQAVALGQKMLSAQVIAPLKPGPFADSSALYRFAQSPPLELPP